MGGSHEALTRSSRFNTCRRSFSGKFREKASILHKIAKKKCQVEDSEKANGVTSRSGKRRGYGGGGRGKRCQRVFKIKHNHHLRVKAHTSAKALLCVITQNASHGERPLSRPLMEKQENRIRKLIVYLPKNKQIIKKIKSRFWRHLAGDC